MAMKKGKSREQNTQNTQWEKMKKKDGWIVGWKVTKCALNLFGPRQPAVLAWNRHNIRAPSLLMVMMMIMTTMVLVMMMVLMTT